jgi:hypothetical protein
MQSDLIRIIQLPHPSRTLLSPLLTAMQSGAEGGHPVHRAEQFGRSRSPSPALKRVSASAVTKGSGDRTFL